MTGINPYDVDGIPRINNRKVIIENVEFENIVVGRMLKTNSEISWAYDAKVSAQELYNKIENYLIESNK